MPATVVIERWTGPAGAVVKTNISSSNTVAAAVDLHQSNASTAINPVKIPNTGSNSSFWVWTTLNVTVAPAARLNNFRWYTDGTNNLGTGLTCMSGWTQSYKQSTGTVGTTGLDASLDPTIGLFLTSTGGWANAFTRTSSSPLSVGGNISVSTTGPIPAFVIIQTMVDNTASPGISSQENFTWVVDET